MYGSIWGDIRHAFLRENKAIKQLILINCIVFVFFGVLRTFFWLTESEIWYYLSSQQFKLPSDFSSAKDQPWSLFTYMFLHEDLLHLLFNMLVLYGIGRIYADYQTPGRVWYTYVIGGILGGLFYLTAFNLIPRLDSLNGYALGASAGVLSVVFALATLVPDHSLTFFLIGTVRIKYVALFVVILDILSIPYSNSGGHIAHLGGACFGITYIFLLKRGTDILKPFLDMKKSFSAAFGRQSPLRIIYSGRQRPKNRKITYNQEEIDRILDKISKSGYEKLTKEEKDFLFRSGKN